jgi:hypothetical protein
MMSRKPIILFTIFTAMTSRRYREWLMDLNCRDAGWNLATAAL